MRYHVRDCAATTNVVQPRVLITDVKTFPERLKWARERKKWSQAELGRRAGLSQGAIGNYEKGERDEPRNLIQLAEALGVHPKWLLKGTGPRDVGEPSNVAPAAIGTRKIPLISYVQAGQMAEGLDFGGELEYLLTDLDLGEHAFALEIKGDSMLPEFKPGDRIIVDPDVAPLPGDFVVAKNGSHEATFKKYRPRGISITGKTIFELVPLNEDYESMRSDETPISIVGTMVEHRKYRRR